MISQSDVSEIPGWFSGLDQSVFGFALDESRRQCGPGGLVEIGCYLGKSAILIGDHLHPGERLTIVDLFEDLARDESNQEEVGKLYPGLTEAEFIANYSRFHSDPPRILRMDSAAVGDALAGASQRFAHVDGSHLCRKVESDIETVRRSLLPQGIVVFDDFRASHTPGVAAAVWKAVANDGLRVVASTPKKLYGTWGDPEPWRSALEKWLVQMKLPYEKQELFHDTIIMLVVDNVW
ncbi:class I SAM-dependent methyltransferase [Nocardia salmonicida]|uniref:class I SAM-dependent methyltransferase n=1 Tax=Nocardia salmonicida TaxID=53431 RepID=UPI003CF6F50A